MLNKKNRIKNRQVIEKLFKKGHLYKNRFFVFKYEETTENASKFAVSVSKKILKKAVHRNHLRRQMYEALRCNLESLKKPIIALVIARPTAADKKVTFQEIQEAIKSFINTIHSNEK